MDSLKNIYYENDFGKLMNSPVQSNLLTFKNERRIELATLLMYFDTNDNSENNGNLSKCELYLYGHKKPDETFGITGKVAPYEYDLKRYWRVHFQNILQSSNEK